MHSSHLAALGSVVLLGGCVFVSGLDEFITGESVAVGGEGGQGGTGAQGGEAGAGGVPDCVAPGTVTACSGDVLWSRQLGADGETILRGVDVAADGSVFVTGRIGGDADFGLGPMVHGGGGDAFLLKLDPDGVPVWQVHLSDVAYSIGTAVRATVDGGAVVAVSFTETITFDTFNVTNLQSDRDDVALARVDADGAIVWGEWIRGVSDESILSIDLDAAGNVYAAGAYENEAIIPGGVTLTENSTNYRSRAMLLSRDVDGRHRWAEGFGSNVETQRFFSVAVAADGNLLVGGEFFGNIAFGTGALTGDAGDGFVARLLADDAQGMWSRPLVGTGDQEVRTVRECPNGDVLVAGTFEDTLVVGDDGDEIASMDWDMFHARLSADGAHVATSAIVGSAIDGGYYRLIECDRDGYTIVGGAFNAELPWGPVAVDLEDAYVVKLDDDGEAIWVQAFGGVDDQQAKHVLTDPDDGSVVVAGSFEVEITIGTETFTQTGAGEDIFVVKLAP